MTKMKVGEICGNYLFVVYNHESLRIEKVVNKSFIDLSIKSWNSISVTSTSLPLYLIQMYIHTRAHTHSSVIYTLNDVIQITVLTILIVYYVTWCIDSMTSWIEWARVLLLGVWLTSTFKLYIPFTAKE